ncbi:hypothetical protein [Nocardioides convexus]|uniref:hypothetical protein n=1 Tax=Nocardioides convexus TaxID=2712224 RepID=UPI0024182CCC|nr:hypothetical protein [Nocardioides convexus]
MFSETESGVPLRGRRGAVRDDDQRRGEPHRGDRADDDPAGRRALPDRVSPPTWRRSRPPVSRPTPPTCWPSPRLVTALRSGLAGLVDALAGTHDHEGLAEAAYHRDSVLPAMLSVREAADALEAVVADDLWSLPTYQEMLFIR